MVGTGGAVTFEMTVPGGAAMTVGGVTAIATRPTHRRRGVLTAIMRRLQADARERGEAISALWAVGEHHLRPLRLRGGHRGVRV